MKKCIEASEPKFVIDARAFFGTQRSDLMQYNGQEVTIQGAYNIDDCGYMYEVKSYFGDLFQAYEDELS